jgi:transcriptional regulator with XRE-family HTH domain
MSKLLVIRQKLNLMQEELSEKTGISIRTIQSIEAGTSPRGHTLKALAKWLEIKETDLHVSRETNTEYNVKLVKIINLSTLAFIAIPPLNILVPLLIMLKKNNSPLLPDR